MKVPLLLLLLLFFAGLSRAEDGYRLWLRYDKVNNASLLQKYKSSINGIQVTGTSPTIPIIKEELSKGLAGLLGKQVPLLSMTADKTILSGTPASSSLIQTLIGSNDDQVTVVVFMGLNNKTVRSQFHQCIPADQCLNKR